MFQRLIAMRRLKRDPHLGLRAISSALHNEPDIVLAALSGRPEDLLFAPDELTHDLSFVKQLLARRPDAYRFINEAFKSNKECCLLAISQSNPENLRQVPYELLDDQEVIVAAIKAETRSLWAPNRSLAMELAGPSVKSNALVQSIYAEELIHRKSIQESMSLR